ncbi:MAG: hypothetical protein KDD72_08555, partial [Anaerolineales bacterium]|nr:hypothetical protein [Anaerolineales bacterium]
MLKSLRYIFLALAVVGSLFLGPVSTVHALTYPAEINKSFTPISISSGGTSILRVTVYNPNTNALTNASWTDNFPAGITVANTPNVTTTCMDTVTPANFAAVTDSSDGTVDPGDTSIKLSGATVPAQVGSNPGSCYVEVTVTSTTPGNLINTIPANALTSKTLDGSLSVDITNTTPASATLNVITVQPPSLSKGFAPNTIYVGELSTLTITIHNNDINTSLTSTTFRDALPTDV